MPRPINRCQSRLTTTRASWEQIHELRRDRDAVAKLRKLRLFLHRNYAGAEPALIEDEMAQMLHDYENACRDHGLETCMSILEMTLDSKNLQTAVTGGIAASLFGGPLAAIGTAAVIELGQILLEFATKRHQFDKFKRDHKLGYIIEARERLQK